MVDQGNIASAEPSRAAGAQSARRFELDSDDTESESTGTDTSNDTESRMGGWHGSKSLRDNAPKPSDTISIGQRDTRTRRITDIRGPANAVASAGTAGPVEEPIPLIPPRIPPRLGITSGSRVRLASRHPANNPSSSSHRGSGIRRPFEESNRNVAGHSGGTYGCAHCRRTFALANELISHIRDLHQEIKRYIRSGCNTPFATAARFREHLAACSMGGRPSTRDPEPDPPSSMNLQVFRDNGNHRKRPEVPPEDSESDSHVVAARRNVASLPVATPVDTATVRQPLRYKYYCPPPCDRVYKSVDTLTQHRAKYHPSAQFTCTTCQDEFPTTQKLKNHLIVNPRHMQIALTKPTLTPVSRQKRPRQLPTVGSAEVPIKLESDSSSEDDVPRVGDIQSSSATSEVGAHVSVEPETYNLRTMFFTYSDACRMERMKAHRRGGKRKVRTVEGANEIRVHVLHVAPLK